jgi:hypothetical protein
MKVLGAKQEQKERGRNKDQLARIHTGISSSYMFFGKWISSK